MELFKYPMQLIWLSAGFAALVFFNFKARASSSRAASALIAGRQLALLTGEKALARKRTRDLLYLAALAFLVAAAGGPQWGMDMAPVTEMNGSLVVAVDTSLSMGAKDLKPSRIENAKLMLNALADKFQDYRMGIIAFSGDAYIQCPLTTDSDAVKYFLSYLTPGILPAPGTDIASAITAAGNMLGRNAGPKVLVLITDGEDLEGGIDGALDSAAAANLKIFTVGIGKPEGELIPEAGQDGGLTGYKKDRSGKTVVTRLDESVLLKIAQRTGAEYIRYGGDPEATAGEIRATVGRLSQSKTKGFGRSVYRNRYSIPLLIAFLLLLIELMFMEKGFAAPAFLAELLKRFRKVPTALFLAALALSSVLPGAAGAASPESLARQGNGAYGKKDFPKAYDYYSKALSKAPKNARILFNRGAAFYRMEDYAKAAEDSEAAEKNTGVKGAAAYNAGNAYFKLSDFPKAIAKYREALIAVPGDRDAGYNLQKALIAQKKAQNQCKKPDEKKQDKKKQDKKQDNKGGGGEDKDNKQKQEEAKKKEEQKKKEAAQQQADKLLELMKEKEKASGSRELMNARFNNKPREKEKFSGKDW
jgi:Ca-activated chloride channel family protein